MLEHLLGVKSTVDGLLLKPCVPETWNAFSVERNFRGARYKINYKKEQNTDTIVILVNGEPLCGNLLSWEEGKTYEVEVNM